MKLIKYTLLLLSQVSLAQVTLSADGPGNTYELINSVLAPGYDVVEAPDCAHSSFGRHIEEVWDAQLNKYVFKFHIHVSHDNDRCIKFDRQRNEIKTYNQSPDNLIGTLGETVVYKWKFKLDAAFQASNKFTHIHQIKAYGGPHEDIPVVSLITRGGSSPKLQVMHSDSITSVQMASANLSLFKGVWVEATETITYAENGKYAITLKKISDNSVLLNYSNNNIRMWRDNANGIRPKWGIYRSLLSPEQLRDEEVLFADFSIQELSTALSSKTAAKEDAPFPNPVKDTLHLKEAKFWSHIIILDEQGKKVYEKKNTTTGEIDVSQLAKGTYILRLKGEKENTSAKFIKQ
ncbi:putative secreted protein (Por secretion system target) [Flavobacterium endophyticum]|uniref:Putative secreted protein (Por secretion system target) n=1 Tax=Flavobacterium endophyticum TaxID=1540163 RepID=A0A495LZT5_9FLAO|nr:MULTISPECIES: T9SS type A sorting domain-containing protein [Flavobacterium]RKS19141.1 putative secreted protein (Por secretion system target) [Flavobacterium endophyticum]WDO11515.1 T9SS type A sorting domain-containing protein [Flavobacterium sp. WW92]